MAGSSFPSSSGVVPESQQLRKFRDLPQQHGSQLSDGNQNEQHVQNTAHQAYLHFGSQNVQQQKSYGSLPSQQQGGKFSMAGPPRRDQDMHVNNLKVQELMSLQTANQAHTSSCKKSNDQHLSHGEKHIEQGQASNEQRNEQKLPQAAIEQPTSKNITRYLQSTQPEASTVNTSSDNQILMAQLQAMQIWALERNIDLFLPANANLIAQILPIWQSSKFAAMQKASDRSTVGQQSCLPPFKPHVNASPVGSETSAHGKSLSDISDQAGSMKNRHLLLTGSLPNHGVSIPTNSDSIKKQQQLAAPNRETQTARPPTAMGSGGAVTHPPQSGRSRQSVDHTFIGNEEPQIHNLMQMQQLNQHGSQSTAPLSDALHGQVPSQDGSAQVPQQHVGFTRQQLHVLKAQIIAFRRLKRGNCTIPNEVLQAIAPPPLDPDQQQGFISSGIVNRERLVMPSADDHAKHAESKGKVIYHAPSSTGDSLTKEEPSIGEDKAAQVSALQGATSTIIEPIPTTFTGKMEQSTTAHSKQEVKTKNQAVPIKSDCNADKGKSVPTDSVSIDAAQLKKPISTSDAPLPKDATATRKHPGPLFDFPHFTKRHDSYGLTTIADSTSLALAYDITDLLFEEGIEALNKKRAENLKKINCLLAINLERKRIRPDLVLKLQIEEKKLRLSDLQTHLRDEIDQEQQEIMASQVIEGIKKNSKFGKAGSSGSSSESRRLAQPATPSMSLQKFGSLSALDSRPKRMSEELEEGEIAVSGDSHMDLQPSDSWTSDREDGEEEQVLQPKIKRKRSLRVRPRQTFAKLEKSGNEQILSQHGSQLASQMDQGHAMKSRNDTEIEAFRQPVSDRHDKHISSLKRQNLPSRKTSVSVEDAIENSKGKLRPSAMSPDASSLSVTKMSDSLHRKCKNVISELLRRIDKGHQLAPLLHDLWNRTENSSFASPAAMPSNLFDLRRIDRRVDNLEYSGVADFMADIHLMLQNTVQYFGNSHEVRSEAKKLPDLFSDIMKIAFPDMDFREARSSFTLSRTGVAISAPFRKPRTLTSVSFSQSMRHKMIPEVEPELGRVNAASSGLLHPDKDVSLREHNLPKKLMPRQEKALQEHIPPPLTHPGDLVICKGKRKGRDKSVVKQRVGSALPLNPGRISSLSASLGRLGPSTGRSNRVPAQRAGQPPSQQAVQPVGWSHQPQQQRANGAAGGGALGMEELQWAKPVKRLRSDAAKRRPSHM